MAGDVRGVEVGELMIGLNFSHYSAQNKLVPNSVEQMVEPLFKPQGLWLSVDGEDDWPTWCRGAEFALNRLAYRFRVRVADGCLHLATEGAVREFADEFGVDITGGFRASSGRPWTHVIEWSRVAGKWPGIIIAPYLWGLRLSEQTWYYSWDVASACIWDVSVIESVSLTP